MLSPYGNAPPPRVRDPHRFSANIFTHICSETSRAWATASCISPHQHERSAAMGLFCSLWGSPPPSLTKMRSLHCGSTKKRLPSVLSSDSPPLLPCFPRGPLSALGPAAKVCLPPGPGHWREPESNEGSTFPPTPPPLPHAGQKL